MPLHQDSTTVLLGIPELEVIGFEACEKKIVLRVKRKDDFEVCPSCGHVSQSIHSHWESRVRHGSMSGKKVVLVVLKRRYRCSCGYKPFLETFHCLEKYQRQTVSFQDQLRQSCHSSSIKEAALKAAVGYKVADRLYYEQAQAKAKTMEKPALPLAMGFDEFSGKRRVRMHMAVTNLDGEKKKLWNILEKKDCLEFIGYFGRYSREEREQVQFVVHDLDAGIASWTKHMFPNALHVADKFHVVRTMLKHMESVRKAAYQRTRKAKDYVGQKTIKSSYYLIKRRNKDLKRDNLDRLERLFTVSPEVRRAYELKEWFMEWYDTKQRRSEAEEELRVIDDELRQTKHFKRFCKTLKNWREPILNYFICGLTNAFTEGMNNKIKLTKRLGYGQRNFTRFRERLLMECVAA